MYDISFETNLGVALQHFPYKFFKDEITYHCNDFLTYKNQSYL